MSANDCYVCKVNPEGSKHTCREEEINKFYASIGTPTMFRIPEDEFSNLDKSHDKTTLDKLIDIFHISIKKRNQLRRIKELSNELQPRIHDQFNECHAGHRDVEIIDELVRICND